MLNINQPNLTAEQVVNIPKYRDKWQDIALNRQPIDREQAAIAIHNAYAFLNLPPPNIVFFANPQAAIQYINREIDDSWGKLENSSLGNPIASKLLSELLGNLNNQIQGQIFEHLQGNLDSGLAESVASEIVDRVGWNRVFTIIWANAGSTMLAQNTDSQTDEIAKNFTKIFLDTGFVFNRYIFPPLWQIQKDAINLIFRALSQQNEKDLDESLKSGYQIVFTGKFLPSDRSKYQLPVIQISGVASNVVIPSLLVDYAYYINYLQEEVINSSLDDKKWIIFYDLITTCGWIFPYQKTVLVCDRFS